MAAHLFRFFITAVAAVAFGAHLMKNPVSAEGLMNAITHKTGLQARLVWADADANLEYLASPENVAELVRNCKKANINGLIVDVKPLSGHVLYLSEFAPRPPKWKGRVYPEDYDLLSTMSELCRKEGLKIYANVNVFSEGSQALKSGTAYDNPHWQAIIYEAERWAKAKNAGNGVTELYPISAVNNSPMAGRLALATKAEGLVLSESDFWLLISPLGKIEYQGGGIDPLPKIEKDSFILFGSGPAADWLKSVSNAGLHLELIAKPRLTPISKTESEHFAIFVNPIHPEAQEHELNIIREIAAKYDIDGIVLDRMRYPNIYADFSDLSREKFEEWLGRKVENWPEDIFTLDPYPGKPFKRGPLFKEWLEWRARNIKNFFEKAACVIRKTKPGALVGVYVGSWYADYYGVGVNWGSVLNKVPYDWASPKYHEAGYAHIADFICTGAYYGVAYREDARELGRPEGATVEAAGQLSNRVIADDTFTYASLYLLEHRNDPEGFRKAIQACLETTQGIMLFDLVYLRDYGWWPILEEMFSKPAVAPHDVPGLKDKIREIRDLIKSSQEKL